MQHNVYSIMRQLISPEATAHYYIANQTHFLIGNTLCEIAMAFLLLFSLQLGVMLWRLDSGSHIATIATTVSLASSPIILSFNIPIMSIAAYRPADINPEITRAISDLAWLPSELIWPQLCVAMVLIGIIILKTQGRPESFPAWTGWLSLIAAAIEPFQAAIVFLKAARLHPTACSPGMQRSFHGVFCFFP